MKALAYVRVSTDEQAREGISLENQESRVRAFCQAKDWELIEVLTDEGYSASSLDRPGMQELILWCQKREVDVVVIYKLDRLTRSVRDLGYLVQDVFGKYGVAFSSIQDNFDTTTANGKLILNILGSVAQWERDIVVERTRDVMAHKRLSLKLIGAIPMGFDLDEDGETLLPKEGELEVVRQIMLMREAGASYRAIVEHLNGNGISAKQGGKWYVKTVRGVLRNPIYEVVM
jgi:DNA invertase Pin-like site-specific DNA recombinase